MNGLCYGHDNPDLWFSDSIESDKQGRPTKDAVVTAVRNSRQALAICKVCPVKDECLAEGMLPENIDYGIWGGTLSGERLLLAGVAINNDTRRASVRFAHKIRESQIV
jgi:hypothetical protein